MNTEQIKETVVHALEDLKGKDIRVINVHGKTTVTDMLVIASGTSTRQVRSLAQNVVEKVKEQGLMPIGVEGDDSGWVLVDLGEVVVHVMTPEVRDYYNIEKLWGEDTPSGQSLH
ncbi:MAG TPA: ribosome silencing factor [Gammaproteobacteria bacterium]